MMRKYQDECHGDLADESRLQSCSADADAARLLVEEFHNLQNNSIVPAMLAWLYYGKCYETLVTQRIVLENPRSYHQCESILIRLEQTFRA